MKRRNSRTVLIVAGLALGGAALAVAVPKEQVTRPEGTEPYQGDRQELVAYGEELWNDPSLSGNGKASCASCHRGNTRMFKKTFLEPYPHEVRMPQRRSKLDSVTAEEMVQFCMVVPMKTDVLPWDSKELAALTAYTVDVVQQAYIKAQK
ncbi:MAG: c-type cytochrome [Pseudomonadales bacterium]